MKPQGLILDMDGTLLDSERAMVETYLAVAASHGWGVDRAVAISTVGTTSARTAEILREAYPGIPHDTLTDQVKDVYFAQLDAGEIPLRPGALELLTEARALGIPVAICSSSPRSVVERALTGAGIIKRFQTLVCEGEAAFAKPDPAPYVLAAQRLGVEPWLCAAAEDSPHGAVAALEAGMETYVVPDLTPFPPELLKRVYSLSTLIDMIPRLRG